MRRVTPLLCLLLTAFAASEFAAADERLQYRGQLVQQGAGGESVPVRSFALWAWLSGEGAARRVIFRVDDEGRGGLAWWERFGQFDPAGDGGPPRLRHVHLDRPYTLTLPSPLVAVTMPLMRDATWEREVDGRRMTYEVTGEQRIAGRDCWEVSGVGDAGRRQTWLVAKDAPILVRATSRVFIGQGERFELQLELVAPEMPSGEELQRDVAAAESLLTLQQDLGLSAEPLTAQLNSEQLARVTAALPALTATAEKTGWVRFVDTIAADIQTD